MRLAFIVAAIWIFSATIASGDPHAEMAAALAAQADLHPSPVSLPTRALASKHAAAENATRRKIAAPTKEASGRAAAQAQSPSQALAHTAQAAAAAAAGQAQAKAAQQRVGHPHPTNR
jgi:hypothetical protein